MARSLMARAGRYPLQLSAATFDLRSAVVDVAAAICNIAAGSADKKIVVARTSYLVVTATAEHLVGITAAPRLHTLCVWLDAGDVRRR